MQNTRDMLYMKKPWLVAKKPDIINDNVKHSQDLYHSQCFFRQTWALQHRQERVMSVQGAETEKWVGNASPDFVYFRRRFINIDVFFS